LDKKVLGFSFCPKNNACTFQCARLYCVNINTERASLVLTSKQIARNVFVTYCSTTNTLFTHTAKTKPKNVSMHTAEFAIKNAAAQQVKEFLKMPALYTLRKKA